MRWSTSGDTPTTKTDGPRNSEFKNFTLPFYHSLPFYDSSLNFGKECGDEGWDYDHVLPYFKRAQNFESGGSIYRGTGGPLHVSEGSFENTPLYEAFVEAGVQAGYPRSEDLNGFQQEGFGRLPMTVNPEAGMRWSTASGYLRPALTRPNLDVMHQTMTEKIIFEGTNAKGLRISNFKNGSETETVYGKEIILAGGAINSPQDRN